MLNEKFIIAGICHLLGGKDTAEAVEFIKKHADEFTNDSRRIIENLLPHRIRFTDNKADADLMQSILDNNDLGL